jgi:hypothetical protein
MATSRINISNKFENGDIPSQSDFGEIFDSFVHKDEDKADFQMVEAGINNERYVTPALLKIGLQNIGIITGNCYMPFKEHIDDFSDTFLPLEHTPIQYSVKVFKNGQLLLEGEDYTLNYDTGVIRFAQDVNNRNIEVDYWYKNLAPTPGGGGNTIDFTNFLHTTGNETKKGILTFNNTTATSTNGIVLTNSGATATALDVTVSGAGNGISLQNSSNGTGVKVSNAGTGVAINVNSVSGSTGDILQVAKNNVVQTKIDSEGNVTAPKFVTSGGLATQFVKGDGTLGDATVYALNTNVIHTTGNESKDGALTLTHNASPPQDVLTIVKNNSANCLKLVQNSNSSATTSTFDTTTTDNDRKAISVQKIEHENAFITHDGNITGTSFTTLNEKADITDGFLTLAGSDSSTAIPGHAKLYAKTNGTTDMYVMGSDGVEKKIGGVVDLSGKENTITPGTTAQYYRGDKSWQTLDKTAVGLANVDNTSDLNKVISIATQAALNAKQATLVSGTNIKTVNGTTLLGSGDIVVGIPSHIEYNSTDVSLWNNGKGNIATNAAFGDGAIKANTSGMQIVAVGTSSLLSNTTGSFNTAVGFESLKANTNGESNTSIGNASMLANTSGSYNIALGSFALKTITAANFNIAIGFEAMKQAISGDNNIAIGPSALSATNTGPNNIAIGGSSLSNNTSGWHNTALGIRSLWLNTTGFGNTGLGYNSLFNNTVGRNNAAIGIQSLGYNDIGSENVAIGGYAGSFWGGGQANANYESNFSIFIGFGASPLANAGYNEIVIGGEAIGAGSGTVTIGNTSITKTILRGQVSGGSFKVNAMNSAPASATATGTTGEIRYTASAIYVCVATNTWVKSALTTW